MLNTFTCTSRARHVKRLFSLILTFGLVHLPGLSFSHPMPNSIVLLDIKPEGVMAELQLPLSELQLAFGHDVTGDPGTLVVRLGPQLKSYVLHHIRPVSFNGQVWTTEVTQLVVQPAEQSATGPYQELTAHIWLQAPKGESSRHFTLYYDVIIHQVVTHSALVSIRQDWEAGMNAGKSTEVGVISLDIPSGTVPPLKISQADGSLWRGFQSMVKLGMEHISEGTDHLMFLLVLLLPAPLLSLKKKWGTFGGVRYSIVRLLKVVTAFTIGHSLTLLVGATGWLKLPGQPVEILIALSILVSAIHAIKPVFPGREIYIAAGFGLVHGLAFATTLASLSLDSGRMALSILGFNIGIELMQLFVIAMVVPWLIMLSRTLVYKGVRIAGATFAGVASVAWIIERVLGKVNPVTGWVEHVAGYAPWIIFMLACAALISLAWKRNKGSTVRLS